MQKLGFFVIVIYFTTSMLNVSAFNLSPLPNYILKEPDLKFMRPKVSPSYFGYSILLQKDRVLVGAPKAQSSLESQRKVDEIGQVYQCFFNTKCHLFKVDIFGDEHQEAENNKTNMISKSKQWFGATMDGTSLSNGSLIICAPNLITSYHKADEYFLHGTCYYLKNGTKPSTMVRITSLQARDKLSILGDDNTPVSNYMHAQVGSSAHITRNSEILLGAPGVYVWSGSVLHLKLNQKSSFQKNYNDVLLQRSRDPSIQFSYFGYAVTSINIGGTIKYVASAPRGNDSFGEVYIYGVKDQHQSFEHSITILKKFNGKQMGEYFGFSLLTDDFNGDGLTDLVISAPLYRSKDSFDNGRVYVYLNIKSFKFEEQLPLHSNYDGCGRFGTTLGKIGDIDGDGFNDIAISAPFEGNGVVYIFRGSETGLLNRPSQILKSPNPDSFIYPGKLFGHGLSKGVDIDQNGYNDLAVGAPQSEEVFIYRSYPVIKIISTISAQSKLFQNTNKTEFINLCWFYKTRNNIKFPIYINFFIKLDQFLKRATFTTNNDNELSFNSTISTTEKCKSFEIKLEFTSETIFQKIEIELHHGLHSSNNFTNKNKFCDSCVTVNPNENTVVKNYIPLSPGCEEQICVSDLKISSKIVNLKPPIIYGETTSFSVEYRITNMKEPAYFTQVSIELSNATSFMRVPANCQLEKLELECNIGHGKPLYQNEDTTILVTLTTSNIETTELIIRAKVWSHSEELNTTDNVVENRIPVEKISDIEIIGKSSMPYLFLENRNITKFEITHEFEIRNYGPSPINKLDFVVSIPYTYILQKDNSIIDLVNASNIIVTGEHNDDALYFKWLNNPKYNPKLSSFLHDSDQQNYYNSEELEEFSNIIVPNDRSIYFNCSNVDQDEGLCRNVMTKFKYFNSGENPVKISINFTLDLEKIDTIFTQSKDILFMETLGRIRKSNNHGRITVRAFNPHTIIQMNVEKEVPWTWIIVSIIIGLLSLMLLIYGLHRIGFFKRPKKEELQVLVRQSQIPKDYIVEPEYF